jgi:hypothetical protein
MRFAVLALLLCACPTSRDGGGGAPQGSGPALSAAPVPAPPPVLASAAPQPEADKIVPLVAGEMLSADAFEGDGFGVELLFETRLLPGSPLPAAPHGVLRVAISGSRARIRFGVHAFAIDENYELRYDRARSGGILVMPSAYRIVPPGALRTLLAERRMDVMPLAPAQITSLGASTHLGRATTRTRVTTAWGTIDLDQVAPMPSPKPAPKGDARSDAGEGGETPQGGEALCRALVELIAADRALGGAPCAAAMIPVRAQIGFATGGGLLLEGTSLREGAVTRSEVAFPPPGLSLSTAPLPDPHLSFIGNEALLSLRPKGDVATLELSNKTPLPRVAMLDGVVMGIMLPNSDRSLSLRASRYALEWRTPLGELIEKIVDVDVPGKATVTQWVPPPLSSASPIASARNGP